MDNVFKIRQDDLGDRLGEIVPFDYIAKPGENVFTAYIFDDIPIRIRSSLTYEEFCKIC